MRISSARFIQRNQEVVFHVSTMNKRLYDETFRGSLFCPTPNCPARVSYVRGSHPHYRTWRYDMHSSNCIYCFERVGFQVDYSRNGSIRMNVSRRRKQQALNDAYKKLLGLTKRTSLPSIATVPKKRKEQTANEQRSKLVQLSLFDGQVNEENTKLRGRSIMKRLVSDVTRDDVGEVRLVMGVVESIEQVENRVVLHVEYQNETMRILFEENFFKERLNSSYIRYFHLINREKKRWSPVYFTGIGNVREREANCYELAIAFGSDFRVNNDDLFELARKYSVQNTVL